MKKPTKAQLRLLDRMPAEGSVMATPDGQEFTLSHGGRVDARVVKGCITKRLLIPGGDGLPGIGESQTFHRG